jgi:hypothetical protein
VSPLSGAGDGGGPLTGGPGYNPPPHQPLRFEANQGQKNSQAQFSARVNGYDLFLTSTEMVLLLDKPPGPVAPHGSGHGTVVPPLDRYVVRMQLVGAKPNASLTGVGPQGGSINYFVGNNPANWLRNVPSYAQVAYANVYPGISALYYGNQSGSVEYDFTVTPGANPATIQLAFTGASGVSLDRHGDLVLHTPFGDVVEHAPVAYQAVNGINLTVPSKYVVADAGHVGFQLGTYDQTLPLVIDPSLSFSTYLGGSADDESNAVAVDSQGNMYIAGMTRSADFPTTFGIVQGGTAGSAKVFVSKINSLGTMVYSTYLGGNGDDVALGLGVDGNGNAYVTGHTNSSTFPIQGGFQSSLGMGASQNAFVVKLSPNGQALVYSSYLGGGGSDTANGIAVDSSGNAFITGQTTSTNFPTIQGAYKTSLSGAQNAFVSEVNAAATTLVYSTYLGGRGSDAGNGIAIDGNDNAYVTGSTSSSDFPTLNGFQSIYAGKTSNAFLTEIKTGGGSLVYSTYLGGSGADSGNGIALDGSNNVYLTGSTGSSDFPVRNASQTKLASTINGGSNAFVAKVAPPASSGASAILAYSTYLGGSNSDAGNSIAVTAQGVAYVTGSTDSPDFPTVNAIANMTSGYLGGTEAFVAKFPTAAGAGPAYADYLGGSMDDVGTGIAVDVGGNAYVTGRTSSTNFPTFNPIQGSLGGPPYDAFVSKVTNDPLAVNLQMYNQTPATEGAYTGPRKLASFTWTSGYQLGQFSATINWGDSSSDTVTPQNNGANCCGDVVGNHKYANAGSYEIGVTINYLPTGAQFIEKFTGILVLDAPLSGTPKTIDHTVDLASGNLVPLQESMALTTDQVGAANLIVAAFTDANTGSGPGDFVATIDWGDGHASTGNVQGQGGSYQVVASGLSNSPYIANIYAHAGVYDITVQVQDIAVSPQKQDAGGSRLTIRSRAVVGTLAPTAYSVVFTYDYEDYTSIQANVATFNGNLYDQFAATIDWGDGQTTAGMIGPTDPYPSVNG